MRAATLVALATGLGAGSSGCGGASVPGHGDVMLSVTVPGDVLIRTADYRLDDMSRAPVEGRMGGTQALHDLSKLIAHVPVGDYVVTARAEATDRQSVCEGSLPVKIAKGAVARVHLRLECRGSGGHVVVGIGVSCRATPLVDLLVSPVSALVGESVIGRADPVRRDGGALTYSWSAPSGTFAQPEAAQTAFTCAQPGPVPLTLAVVDDQACEQTQSATVTCLPAPDGGLDARDAVGGDADPDAADADGG